MMKQTFCIWVLCLAAVLFKNAAGQGGSAVVLEAANCKDLRDIFENIRTEKRIIITKNMRCTRENWPTPVLVSNRTIIEGSKFGENVPAIDWAGSTNAVVVSQHASLTFRGIVLMQDFIQLGGLKLAFAQGVHGAQIEILGSGVGIRTCQQHLESLIPVFEDTPRPSEIPGEQEITRRSSQAVFADNIAFVPVNSDNGTWSICNSVFQCDVDSPFQNAFQRTLNRESLDQTCSHHRNPQTVSTLGTDDSDGGGDSGRSEALFGTFVALFTIAVFVILVYVAYKVWGVPYLRQRKAMQGDEESQMASKPFDSMKDPKFSFLHRSSVSLLNSGLQLPDIELGVPLGKGTVGTVYKGYHNNIPLAVKVVDVETSEAFGQDDDLVGAFVAQHLYHANVVEILLYQTHRIEEPHRPDPIEDQITTHGESLAETPLSSIDETRPAQQFQYRTFFVMEFCNLGSLENAMDEGVFMDGDDEPKMLMLLRSALDIAKGMRFLHSSKIIHGQLRPGNVLLKGDSTDSRGFTCKVSDFGLKQLNEKQQAMELNHGLNLAYRAPETLQKGTVDNGSDVFAFGMLLWSMYTGIKPFSDLEPSDILGSILEGTRPEIPDSAPRRYERLIKDCWHADISARPPFANIIERLNKIVADTVRSPESICSTPKHRGHSTFSSAAGTVIIHGGESTCTSPLFRGQSNVSSVDMGTVIIHGSESICSTPHRALSNVSSVDMGTVIIHGSGSINPDSVFEVVEDGSSVLSGSSPGGTPVWERIQQINGLSPKAAKPEKATYGINAHTQVPKRTISSFDVKTPIREHPDEDQIRPERTNPGTVPSKPSETVSLRYGFASGSVDSEQDDISSDPSLSSQNNNNHYRI